MSSTVSTFSQIARRAALAGVLSVSAFALAACSSSSETKFAASTPAPESAEVQQSLSYWGERYRTKPNDAVAAQSYAQALIASGQRAQAVAVMQRAVLGAPHDLNLKVALGNALASNGQFEEALNVYQQAHSTDRPNWRVLSAQGAVLDQVGRSQEARKYYQTALRIQPDEPSILSNLALSYALTGDLAQAEKTIRRAEGMPGADQRVRQNLALIVGLQGRFTDAENIAQRDLSADEAEANTKTLRAMLVQQNTWQNIQGAPPAGTQGYPQYAGNPQGSFAASTPRSGPRGALPSATYDGYGAPVAYSAPSPPPYGALPPTAEPYGYTPAPARPNDDIDTRPRQNEQKND